MPRRRTPPTPAPDRLDQDDRGLTYADAGVSIDEGDRFASLIRQHMRRTHGPRVLANDGGFAGLFRLDYNETLFKRNYKDPVLVACTDGVGTKILLALETGHLENVGIDLVAMNVNDLVVQGAEPLLFLDYIACAKVVPERLERIVSGIAEACRSCGAALIGGETAEMPGVYEGDDLDLAGFALGVLELKKAMNPLRVAPGDVVIGLESDGVHSNGFSLVRAVLERGRVGLDDAPDELAPTGCDTVADALMRPTRVYAGPVTHLLRQYRVKKVVSGMAHITGGGLAGNLRRALHNGVDANLRRDAWHPDPVFALLQRAGSIPDDELWRTFNMGIGYCLIVRPSFADSVARQLARLGERPRVIGEIVAGAGDVTIG